VVVSSFGDFSCCLEMVVVQKYNVKSLGRSYADVQLRQLRKLLRVPALHPCIQDHGVVSACHVITVCLIGFWKAYRSWIPSNDRLLPCPRTEGCNEFQHRHLDGWDPLRTPCYTREKSVRYPTRRPHTVKHGSGLCTTSICAPLSCACMGPRYRPPSRRHEAGGLCMILFPVVVVWTRRRRGSQLGRACVARTLVMRGSRQKVILHRHRLLVLGYLFMDHAFVVTGRASPGFGRVMTPQSQIPLMAQGQRIDTSPRLTHTRFLLSESRLRARATDYPTTGLAKRP
jgi:hypothetical protein